VSPLNRPAQLVSCKTICLPVITLSREQIDELDQGSDIELGLPQDFIDEHSHSQSPL
jgi:hypothetical protein